MKVYVANPKLLQATEDGMQLWNTAAGSRWLTLTTDPKAADVTVHFATQGQAKQAAGEAGGSTNAIGGNDIAVYADYDAYPSLIAHELGHVMGLMHLPDEGEYGGPGVMGAGNYLPGSDPSQPVMSFEAAEVQAAHGAVPAAAVSGRGWSMAPVARGAQATEIRAQGLSAEEAYDVAQAHPAWIASPPFLQEGTRALMQGADPPHRLATALIYNALFARWTMWGANQTFIGWSPDSAHYTVADFTSDINKLATALVSRTQGQGRYQDQTNVADIELGA